MPEELTRHGFVLTSLAAGFALAVQPVMGQTVITTDGWRRLQEWFKQHNAS